MKYTMVATVVLASALAGGCSSKDRPPTPTTASFDMEPAPRRSWGRAGVDEESKRLFGLMGGRTTLRDVQMVESASPDERRKGIYNLARRSWGQREPYLSRYRQLAKSDPDRTVRAAAVRALNASRDRQSVAVFIEALTDAEQQVRLQAAKALSNIPDPTAAEPLSRVVGNQAEQKDVRIAAAEALRHYRQIGVARVLAGTLGGRDFSIAWQSRWSLRIMTGKDYEYSETAWLEFLTGPGKPLG